MNAMRQAHADGWFIVFDTLTLADDRLEAFYDNPNALRDYFRDIGRMVLAAEGRKANDSHAEIGRASCRERVWIAVVAVSCKKKAQETSRAQRLHDPREYTRGAGAHREKPQ